MKILLTGANSFTGYWFARTLASAGHDLTMTLRRNPSAYDGIRQERATMLKDFGQLACSCSFGDDQFLETIANAGDWDLLCHHASDVTDYRSPNFDVPAAFAANTRQIDRVFATLAAKGGTAAIITGSVFEPGEGAGSGGLPAFSAYGLSKALTARSAAFYAERHGLALGKFVIPNPFGPFEEPRFTAYLMRTWLAKETASVRTPDYVRDNIHVSLLSLAYARFADEIIHAARPMHLNPSGYIESQGAFATRFRHAMQARLNLPCGLNLLEQIAFDEPRVRINTDPVDGSALGWDEAEAWDTIAEYYLRRQTTKT